LKRQNAGNVFFGSCFFSMFFEPCLSLVKCPAFVFAEKVALHFHRVFAFGLADYCFDAFLFAYCYGAETVGFEIVWVTMTATNVLVSFFPWQSLNQPSVCSAL
jgi:hypothetical protein